jgi:hypothetical protein
MGLWIRNYHPSLVMEDDKYALHVEKLRKRQKHVEDALNAAMDLHVEDLEVDLSKLLL